MSDRTVDLNDKPRAAVELRLGDKSFRIVRVVMGVRRLYGDLTAETGDALAKVADLKDADGGELDRLVAEVEDFAERKQATLFRIVELLLTKNGYEYDREWWEDNADENDLRDFIIEAVNKDLPPDQKKTVVTVADA